MTDLSLPASYRWGYVVGRVVEAIADTAADSDDKPEARFPSGAVVFTPVETLRKTVNYSAFVVSRPARASIGTDGRIIDAEGRPGIWLVTGLYRVSFSIDAGNIPDFLVEVAESHTTAAPLDLVTAAPPTIPAGVTVQTLVVPAGGTPGQVLTRADSGLRWAAVETVGHLIGTGSPEGVRAAPPGTYCTDTDITLGVRRWYKAAGTDKTGWVVDSGCASADITARLQNGAVKGGGAPPNGREVTVLHRDGCMVTCTLSIAWESWTSGAVVINIPKGFRPAGATYLPPAYGNHAGTCVLDQYGDLRLYSTTASSVAYRGHWTWITADPWPTTLTY